MNPRLVFLLLGAALAFSSRAELPPSAYEKMQSAAPEVLRVHVLRIDIQPTSDAAVREVTALAETLKVGRSKSKIKVGDMITIRYRVTTHPPGWVGPGEVPVLKEDEETVAYLSGNAETQEFTPVAGAMSFDRF